MDIKKLQKLTERQKARKTSTNLGGRPTSGKFYTRPNFPGWYWALVRIGRKEAEILSTIANSHGLPETKFSANLLENYLGEFTEKRTFSALEVIASGLKFSGSSRSRETVWLEIRLSENLARTARDLKRRDSQLRELTDYQLISSLLERAMDDFLLSAKEQSLTAKTAPDQLEDEVFAPLEIEPEVTLGQPEPVFTEEIEAMSLIEEPLGSGDLVEIPRCDEYPDPALDASSKSKSRLPNFIRKAGEARRKQNIEL